MAKPYTADRAYRLSVLPLGVFMIFGGVILFTWAMLMSPEQIFVPPFKGSLLERVVFGGLSLALLSLGIGFCFRSKVAWWCFFVWMLIGIIWHVIAGILDPQFASLAILSPAFNIPIAVGIYYVTKPAFLPNARDK